VDKYFIFSDLPGEPSYSSVFRDVHVVSDVRQIFFPNFRAWLFAGYFLSNFGAEFAYLSESAFGIPRDF